MDSLRERIATFLGRSAPSVAPDVRVLSSIEEDEFRRKLLQYPSRDGEEIQAFLFVPNGPCAWGSARLAQHNSQWEIGKNEVAGLVGDPLQAFGPPLEKYQGAFRNQLSKSLRAGEKPAGTSYS